MTSQIADKIKELDVQIKSLEIQIRFLQDLILNPPKPTTRKTIYVHPMDVARLMMDPRSSNYNIEPFVPVP